MKATSAGRKLVVVILLVLAVIGAFMRLLIPPPSLARDIGNLLLVLWVPVIGNVVGWVLAKLRIGPKPPPDFQPGAAFVPHLEVEMTPLAAQQLAAIDPVAPEETRFALVLGRDGVTARLQQPLAEWLAGGRSQTVQIELLRPALGLPRLLQGTSFRILAGQSILGEGRVLRVLTPGIGPG